MSDISNEGKSPWEDDVAAAFEDEDIAQKVSAFLGEKVQPYVTKVEQEAAPNRDAANLYTAFAEQPVETSIQTTRELYGDEIADKFAALLSGGDTAEEAATKVQAQTAVDVTDQTAATSKQIEFDQLPPEVKEQFAQQSAKNQREAYQAELDKTIEAHKAELTPEGAEGPQFDKELFHPFVVASQGDFEKAFTAYQNFQNQAKEKWGIQVPDTGDGKTTPPPVMNSTTKASGTKPPQEVKYESLDEAMDAFFEEANQAPPTVGSA